MDVSGDFTDGMGILSTIKNNAWILKHLLDYRHFDYEFSIDLFCDSLKELGDNLEHNGCSLTSKKDGRKAKTASYMLRNAYNYQAWKIDKSFDSFLCNTVDFSNLYSTTNRKFFVINDRREREESQLKEDAWNFIKKHIDKWWY